MKLRIHPKHSLILSLGLLGLSSAGAYAQALPPEDFFHDGAVNYLSNNIPKALQVVTNGRALYPDDIKLKKLEELLKQQNQQQQQQQQQQDQKQQEQQKQQKEKQDQQQQQASQEEQKEDEKTEEQKDQEQKVQPGQMTPEEAKRLLDAQRGEEKTLQFRPEGKPRDPSRPFKDW